MKFELFDGNNIITAVDADTSNDAWKQLGRAGFKKRSELYTLIENGY